MLSLFFILVNLIGVGMSHCGFNLQSVEHLVIYLFDIWISSSFGHYLIGFFFFLLLFTFEFQEFLKYSTY
jgi:hypothetical protein